MEITELKYTTLIKIIILEENFKWNLEAFASELFIYIYMINNRDLIRHCEDMTRAKAGDTACSQWNLYWLPNKEYQIKNT